MAKKNINPRTESKLAHALNQIVGIDELPFVPNALTTDHCWVNQAGEITYGVKDGSTINRLNVETGKPGETTTIFGKKNTLLRAAFGMSAGPMSQIQCDAAAEAALLEGRPHVTPRAPKEKEKFWLGTMRANLTAVKQNPQWRFVPLNGFKPLKGAKITRQFAQELARESQPVQAAFQAAYTAAQQQQNSSNGPQP
ncbi:MAG: hypothetical protein OXT65_07310 [Alphaproteobacteria bacterium]|nr:hypothetical protein [Alphaproteobacteria bacterium]